MSIIDRYVAKVFVGFFLGGLVVFVTIFLTVDFMSNFNKYQVPLNVIGQYYLYFCPAVIHQMIPMGCLMATIFTLSSLNKHHELTALFSMGRSLARVSAPILIIVALLSVIDFWLNDRLLPRFAQKKQYVELVEIKKKPGLYSTVKMNKIWFRTRNTIFYIQTMNPDKSSGQGIALYYFDNRWKLVELIRAAKVKMQSEVWELSNGTITLFTKDSSFPLSQTFSNKLVTMDKELADLQATATSSDVMTLSQLGRFIEKNKEAGLETIGYEMDYHGKFGFALASFVLTMLGVPLSVNRQRAGGMFLNIGICLGLAVVYWLSFSSCLTLGRHGMIPPILAAWLPNVGMSAIALVLLNRLKR